MVPCKLKVLLVALAGVLVLASCATVGPKSIEVDRFDYSTAIADSWKQQTLLNIVKLRYLDLPVFVDVSSIVAGYSIETSASVGGQLSSAEAIPRNSLTLGASSKYTDRPTITYVPLTGEKFLRGLLTPIDPKNIFFLLQSGYAADFILGLTVESLNGLHNRSASADAVREADPDFLRVLELMRDLQMAGAIGMRVEDNKATGKTAVLFIHGDDVDAKTLAAASEIRRLLKLPEGQERFVLNYSPVRERKDALSVNSRSMLQVMAAFSSYVDLPEAHRQNRSALVAAGDGAGTHGLERVRIRSGSEKPVSTFAAVQYRGHWFWIDDDSWQTKRALISMVYFFTLIETGAGENLPLITIPAQ
jgi:hypothetical protein